MSIRLRIDHGPVAGFGERLALAERLIRAGARAAVVNEALETRGALRVLVTRLHRESRRPDRPRGPLPSDLAELLSTRALRLEGSAFLAAWDHLRAAGRIPAVALIEAWEATHEMFAGRPRSRRFTIDHAWVLASGRGRLVMRRCTRCVAAWYEVARASPPGRPDEAVACREATAPDLLQPAGPGVATEARCPHCHPVVPACGRAPGAPDRATAVATGASAAASAMPDALASLADRFRVAEALIAAGARLPVVAHLTSLPAAGILRQLYIEVSGERPRQGALPQLGAHVLATSRLRMEASVLVVTASRLLRAGAEASHALLGAWRTYRALFGERASFDINAAALVVRARRHPDFQLVTCPRCRTEQIELRSDLRHRRCRVGRSLRVSGRQRAGQPEPPASARDRPPCASP